MVISLILGHILFQEKINVTFDSEGSSNSQPSPIHHIPRGRVGKDPGSDSIPMVLGLWGKIILKVN